MVATKYGAASKADLDEGASREILISLSKKVLAYGLPLFILAIIFTSKIRVFLNFDNDFALMMVWFLMLLSFLSAINNGILAGWQKFKSISSLGVWGALIKLIFVIVALRAGYAINGIVGSFLAGVVASYAISFFSLSSILSQKKTAKKIARRLDLGFRKYVIPVLLGNLALAVIGNADMILARRNLDGVASGQYGALTIMSKIIFFVASISATVLFSMSSENKHKNISSEKILKTAIGLTLVVTVCGSLFYLLFPKLVLAIPFGNKYENVSSSLILFAVSASLYSLVNIIYQYLLSIHRIIYSYFLLGIAAFSVMAIIFFGHDMASMIKIMISFEVAALFFGVIFITSGTRAERPR
jgi:O-antigen/teichoic acid export membrane protein